MIMKSVPLDYDFANIGQLTIRTVHGKITDMEIWLGDGYYDVLTSSFFSLVTAKQYEHWWHNEQNSFVHSEIVETVYAKTSR